VLPGTQPLSGRYNSSPGGNTPPIPPPPQVARNVAIDGLQCLLAWQFRSDQQTLDPSPKGVGRGKNSGSRYLLGHGKPLPEPRRMLLVIRKMPARFLIRPALVMALFISLLLAQTARVEGTVRTLAGEPVARVTIQFSPNGDRGLAGFTTTDDSGKFVLEKRFAGQKLSFDCHEGGFLTRVCQPN